MRVQEYTEIGPGGGILIEHEHEEPLRMGIGQYGANVGKQINRIFQDLNEFWAWRPKEEQLAIFNIYRDLNEEITSSFNENAMAHAFREAIRALAEYHKPALIEHWLRLEGRMYLPDNLNDVLDVNYPREQTYVTSDYWGLLAYTTSLKALFPIFAEAVTSRKSDDTFAFLVGYQLMSGTMYLECEEFQRLEVFVEFILNKEKVTSSAGAILNGLSTTEIPRWVMSSVLVERLVTTVLPRISDVEDEQKTQPLIANLYRHVKKQITKLISGSVFATKEKVYESVRANEEDNTSFAENYPKVETAGHVALALFNHYEKDVIELARHIKADVDVDHLRSLLAVNMAREQWAPLKFQLKLVGIVTWPVISAFAHGNLLRGTTMNAITTAQVVLHELGLSTISDIIGMTPAPIVRNVAARNSTGEKIKEDQLAVLGQLMPYQRVLRGGDVAGAKDVRREGRPRHSIKNPAVHAIDTIMGQINDRRWLVHTDEKIREASEMMATSSNNEHVIPYTMRNILADFFIEFNS